MKRLIIFTFLLLSVAAIFFYLGYEPQLSDIDVIGSFFGYNVQMSQYTLYGIFILLLASVYFVLKFFIGVKNIYTSIIGFITGYNKEKATDNLLNAYAYLLGKRPKTARNYLRKAERYYKDSPHTALMRLLIEQSHNTERPTSGALAKVENDKNLRPVGLYAESLFSVSQKDDMRMINLLKEAGNFSESLDGLYSYLAILIRQHHYNDAEIALKNARSIIPDNDYKLHIASICLLKSHQSYEEKNPDDMLAFALEALRVYKNHPIAISYAMQAYKTLQRDNKAIRLLHDYLIDSPSMNFIRLFLEFKTGETPEDTAKRIASLPRNHENSEAFIALQAYHFAVSRDFISLTTALNSTHDFFDNLWVKVAKLSLMVEKDTSLLSEILKLLKEALYVKCCQEIKNMYNISSCYIYSNSFIYNKFIPEITEAEIIAKLSLFKKVLKSIPIIHKKNTLPDINSIESPHLYKLEADIYKDKI